jgi:hypothetical protein
MYDWMKINFSICRLQVIKEVLSNPADKATISLLFANRTEKDM